MSGELKLDINQIIQTTGNVGRTKVICNLVLISIKLYKYIFEYIMSI